MRSGVDRLLPPVAALLTVAGFVDLALGGTAVAATLLVVSYAVAIPAAIVRGRLPGRQASDAARLPR